MTAYGTVAYYRERLAAQDPADRQLMAINMIESAAYDPDDSDTVKLARVRAVLAALDEVRADPTGLLAG